MFFLLNIWATVMYFTCTTSCASYYNLNPVDYSAQMLHFQNRTTTEPFSLCFISYSHTLKLSNPKSPVLAWLILVTNITLHIGRIYNASLCFSQCVKNTVLNLQGRGDIVFVHVSLCMCAKVRDWWLKQGALTHRAPLGHHSFLQLSRPLSVGL